mmetsp:Transcript_25265/g.41005  ORF Transcript_25265/g.41005 Transcript_25265/m.41005 type:complete len:209 (-) Transcript_25265:734-1360(-)
MMLRIIMISFKNNRMIKMMKILHSCLHHPPSYQVHPSKRNVSSTTTTPNHLAPSLPTSAAELHPSTTFPPNLKCPKHLSTGQSYSPHPFKKKHGDHHPTLQILWMGVWNWTCLTLIPTIYNSPTTTTTVVIIHWQLNSMHHKNQPGSVSTLPHHITTDMIRFCSILTHVNSNGGDNWSLTIRRNQCGGMIYRYRCQRYLWYLARLPVR